MYRNHVFNTMDEALPAMMRVLLRKGEENGSRNGTVKELMHTGITLCQPWRREITLDHRKPNLAAQIAETMWVLTGRNDMDFLTKYLPRATDYSDDGTTWRGAYGPRLRQWWTDPENPVDQWQHVLDLLQRDPLSRRAVAAIYDPAQDSEDGLDIPCNNWLNFSSRLGKLDLHVAIRSNDIMWGWSGINAFEWSAMLEISAAILGVHCGALHFSTTSLHLYAPHWAKGEKVAVDQPWLGDPLEDSPRYRPDVPTLAYFDQIADDWFQVEAKIREQGASAARWDVENFPEPMLKSWLRVLQWWWSGDHVWLQPLAGTRLEYATHTSMQPPARDTDEAPVPEPVDLDAITQAIQDQTPSEFVQFAIKTHNEKHVAYGDSWKRRGEMLGIMANVARKVDRLGGADTSDETSADTAMDLMVYLAKYRTWINDAVNGTATSDTTEHANALLLAEDRRLSGMFHVTSRVDLEESLRSDFDELESAVMEKRADHRVAVVERMLVRAYLLARFLYEQQGDDYRGADRD